LQNPKEFLENSIPVGNVIEHQRTQHQIEEGICSEREGLSQIGSLDFNPLTL